MVRYCCRNQCSQREIGELYDLFLATTLDDTEATTRTNFLQYFPKRLLFINYIQKSRNNIVREQGRRGCPYQNQRC